VPDGKSLVAELQPLKSKILKLAEASAAAAPILQQLPDDCSEGSDFLVSLMHFSCMSVCWCIDCCKIHNFCPQGDTMIRLNSACKCRSLI